MSSFVRTAPHPLCCFVRQLVACFYFSQVMIRDHSKTQTQNNNLQYGGTGGMPQVSHRFCASS